MLNAWDVSVLVTITLTVKRNACYFQRVRNYMFILDHVPKIKYYSICKELVYTIEFLNF